MRSSGFIITRSLDACVLEIEDLFVDPDWMRTGVASRLVEDLLATASRTSVRRIELTANPHANAFYRHVGFVQGHDSETRLGGAPRMYLTLHGDEADQDDTGFDLGEQLTMASTRRAYAVLSSVRST